MLFTRSVLQKQFQELVKLFFSNLPINVFHKICTEQFQELVGLFFLFFSNLIKFTY